MPGTSVRWATTSRATVRWAAASAVLGLVLAGAAPATAADTGSIHGTVTSATGAPARGYLVEIYDADGDFVDDSTVDSLGVFSVTEMAADEYTMKVVPAASTLNLARAWYAGAAQYSGATKIPVGAGPVIRNMVLQPGVSLSGTVTGSQPLVSLTFCGEGHLDCTGVSAREGAFRLYGLQPHIDLVTAEVGDGFVQMTVDGSDSADFTPGALTNVVVDTDARTITTVAVAPGGGAAAPGTGPGGGPPQSGPEPAGPKADTTRPTIRKAVLRQKHERAARAKSSVILRVGAHDDRGLRLVQARHRQAVKTQQFADRVRLPQQFREGTVRVRVADTSNNWSAWKRALRR